MESGADSAAKENAEAKRLIMLRAISVLVQTLLFVAIVVATALRKGWDQWVAIPILLLGGTPMLYKAFMDIRRCVIANVNLLMLLAVVGTMAMREWLDACLIVYVFSIAELLLQICYFKVEESLSGLFTLAWYISFSIDFLMNFMISHAINISEVKQSQIYDARLCTSNHEKTF